VSLSPKKLPGPSKIKGDIEANGTNGDSQNTEAMDVDPSQNPFIIPDSSSSSIPSTPQKPKQTIEDHDGEEGDNPFPIPPPFTPSINRTLRQPLLPTPHALPDGLTVSILKGRLEGKKIKGAFLTPEEMESLTEGWQPYRSVGESS
jgi:DNA-3-methyladenine glycosylase II